MNATAPGLTQRFTRTLDILGAGARQAADNRISSPHATLR